MRKILVIADDFTGAAELAGVGHRLGVPSRLVRGTIGELEPGLTVLDTETRVLSPQQASHVLRRLAPRIRAAGYDLLFKKTDSVLRGPVAAELETLLEITGKPTALLVPQNPSRGRTIEAGVYYVRSVRLDQTTFADDPVHPRRSARVEELLGPSALNLRCLTLGDVPNRGEIAVGTGRSIADVRHWVQRVTDSVLPAGGADFFQALLSHQRVDGPNKPNAMVLLDGPTLFVCGTASAQRDDLIARARKEGAAICMMPEDVVAACAQERQPDPQAWVQEVRRSLAERLRAVMVIPARVDRIPGISRRLESAMSDAVYQLLDLPVHVPNLLMEGGSTAAAVCRCMGWDVFTVEGEFGGGVVQMRASASPIGQRVVVKPGSYPWPAVVWQGSRVSVTVPARRRRAHAAPRSKASKRSFEARAASVPTTGTVPREDPR